MARSLCNPFRRANRCFFLLNMFSKVVLFHSGNSCTKVKILVPKGLLLFHFCRIVSGNSLCKSHAAWKRKGGVFGTLLHFINFNENGCVIRLHSWQMKYLNSGEKTLPLEVRKGSI